MSGQFAKGFWSVLMCLVLVSGVSFAKERYGSNQPQQQSMTENRTSEMQSNIPGREGNLQSAKKLIGMDIKNPQGEKLGDVKEVVLDQSKDKIAYVIVSHDNALHPIPWKAFNTGDKTYTLNLTGDNFKNAPTIKSLDNLDQLSGSDMKQKAQDFYSQQISSRENTGERASSWMKEKGQRVMGTEQRAGLTKCSDIMRSDIEDNQGNKIAKLYDVVFDTREGNVAYGLAHVGGVAGIAAKTAAVPWSAIKPELSNGVAKLNVDKNTLESAEIPRGDLAKLNDPTFARQVHQTFGKEPYWEVYGYVPPAAPAGGAAMSSAWNPDSEYNKHFDPAAMTTVEATVKSIDTFKPESNASAGQELKVQTTDGKTETVQLGPESYSLSKGIRFNEGDKVTITGSKTRVGLKSVIMATEVKKGDQTLTLRDPQGKPEWKTEMMQQEQRPGRLNQPMDTNKEPNKKY